MVFAFARIEKRIFVLLVEAVEIPVFPKDAL
jgi:hypothetical protein